MEALLFSIHVVLPLFLAAVSSYPMAAAMGGDDHLASGIVVVSSAFAVLTFTIGIWLLKLMGIF